MIDFLVKKGCEVNHVDTYGQNPIFYAVREGHMEAFLRLIALGSNPDLIDNNK